MTGAGTVKVLPRSMPKLGLWPCAAVSGAMPGRRHAPIRPGPTMTRHRRPDRNRLAPFLALLSALALSAVPGGAQTPAADAGAGGDRAVRLTAAEGLFDLTGTLASFDGRTLLVDTALGRIAVPAAAVRCAGAACPPPDRIAGTVRVAGTPRLLARLMPELIDAYGLQIDTDLQRSGLAGGSTLFRLTSYEGLLVLDAELAPHAPAAALAEVAAGRAGLAVVPRRAAPAEARAILPGGHAALARAGLERVLALDALAVVAGASVPMEALSREDLARLLGGEVRNWSALGGPDRPVSLFLGAPGGDVREILEATVLDGVPLRADAIPLDGDAAVVETVAAFPHGIGIVRADTPGAADLALPVRDACGTPVPPNLATIKAGGYPLVAPVHAYRAPSAASEHATGLLEFAATVPGQEMLRFAGHIDLLPEPVLAPGGPEGAERLTTTFRPPAPGVPLSPRARGEMAALAEHLASGAADGHEVLFVDRSGGRTPAAAADMLAALFAAAPALEGRLEVAFTTLALPAPPGSCAGGPARRGPVEVWTRPLREAG